MSAAGKDLEVHELANAFPSMPDGEYAELLESIGKNGLRDPIILYEGRILDGRHRYRACLEGDIEPRFETFEGSLVEARELVEDQNLRRRHLTREQRVAIAVSLIDKVRPPGRPRRETSSDEKISREQLMKTTGLTRTEVDRIRSAAKEPDLLERLREGKLKPWDAERIAKLRRAERRDLLGLPPLGPAATAAAAPKAEVATATTAETTYSVAEWKKIDERDRAAILATAAAGPGRGRFNEQTGESIGWARWSWNPVTGCLHACPYCYARDIALDFAARVYPQGFAPTFLPDRLAAPAATKVPARAERDPSFRNVFTCSMADLFGRWVPRDWIEAVLDQVRAHPEWNFLFLTKFPTRYREFRFPQNAWVGTTVDHQARVAAAERAMAEVDAETKWLSIEPMLTPLRFERLKAFQWIVLGGASRSSKTPEWRPPVEWWAPLQAEARAKGIAVFHKTNLYEQVVEYPWQPPRNSAAELPDVFHYLRSKSPDVVEGGEAG